MTWRSVRHLFASAGIVGIAMLGFAGSALPVQAASFGTNGFTGRIVNHDGQCLDMRSTVTDAQAQVEPCNGQLEQEWTWIQVRNGGPYLLRNGRSHQCLTIRNHYTGIGGKVVQTPLCSTSDIFEQWDPGPPMPEGVEISNVGDGLVMHPALCTTAIGAEIYMNVANQCAVDFWHG